jgi:hypothetical protein
MPFSSQLQNAVKSTIYDSILNERLVSSSP